MLLVYLDLLAQLVFVFNYVLTCLFGGTESCHTYGIYCQGCQKHKVEDKIGEENEAANTSPLFIDKACHQWVLQEIGAVRFHLKMCRANQGYEECVHSLFNFFTINCKVLQQ